MRKLTAELRALGDAELQKRLDETYEELFKLRFQHALRQLSNTRRLRFVRRQIARVKTLQSQRLVAPAGTPDGAP